MHILFAYKLPSLDKKKKKTCDEIIIHDQFFETMDFEAILSLITRTGTVSLTLTMIPVFKFEQYTMCFYFLRSEHTVSHIITSITSISTNQHFTHCLQSIEFDV